MSRWWRGRRKEEGASVPEPGDLPLETVDQHNFAALTSGGLTAVDFWAPWCSPCRAFAPVFAEVAGRNGDRVRFGKCNVDENGPVAALLQILSIPTVVLFGPDGSEIGRIAGFLNRRQLERLVAGTLEQVRP
jgi:thioredoxin 1